MKIQDFEPFEIENFEGNLQLQNFDKPFYLQFKTERFWEITLKGNKTEINFGKLKNGQKDEIKQLTREQFHESNESAKEYLLDKIGFKRAKGYNLKDYDEIEEFFDSRENSQISIEEDKSSKNNNNELVQFNYDEEEKKVEDSSPQDDNNIYFEKWQEFVQLESLWPVIKINKGKINQRDKNETNYVQFGSKLELSDYIKNIKQELQLKGFQINNSKLKISLNQDEIDDYKKKLAQYLTQQQSQPQSQYQYSGKNSKNYQKKKPAAAPQILIHQATKDLSDSEEEKKALSDKPLNNLLQVSKKRQNRFKNLSANSSLSDLTDQIQSRSRSLSREQQQQQDSNQQASDTSSVLGPMKNGSSSVMLAHKYEDNQVNPKGYFMSEKLDGIRCFWNGKKMYSRNGNEFFCPKWFTRGWPQSQLDGELWTNRNEFEACVKIVRQQNPVDSEWKKVTYLVFDAPGLNVPFKSRYAKMQKVFEQLAIPQLQLVPNILCKGQEHLEEELKKVEAKKGEGLMLKNPESYYQFKRSYDLLKVKTFHDEEAIVIGYKPGKGNNSQYSRFCEFYLAGVCGALFVRNEAGVEFYVGSGLTDKERRHPPKKGTKITYKYQNLTNSGKPRFPTFQRIYQGP